MAKSFTVELDEDPRGRSLAAVTIRREQEGVRVCCSIRFERGCDYTQHTDTRPSRIIIEGGQAMMTYIAEHFGMVALEAPPHGAVEKTLKNIEGLLEKALAR